ncbi:hypothetical protein [Streptomyces sp. IBSBF 3352]|uniref:hypothetical protein n=1 Tax=Streptomyces sp. IBSBF 3352 TaxID=2903523 RepID=UPI002FDB988B
MDPLLIALLATVITLSVVAVASVLIAHFALKDTDSGHRAHVLSAAAEFVRAIRGKK